MPVCFKTAIGPQSPFAKDGVSTTNPDGTVTFTPRTDFKNCEYVVLDGADYERLSFSPSAMSTEDGAVAAGLIVSCWVAAYAVRSVISVFRGSSKDE